MTNEGYSVDQLTIIDLRNSTFIEALVELEKRPYLWLQECNVINLQSFINGWILGRRDREAEIFLEGFDSFVTTKFHEENSTCGWCNLIVKHCGHNDSLGSFFRILSEYQADL